MKQNFTKKMSLLLFFITISVTQLLSQAPSFQWVNQGFPKPGGSTPQVKAGCIALDALGNSYVTGTFVGRTVFGKGTDTLVLNGRSAGSNDMGDMYLAKYDQGGKIVWVREGLNRQHHVSQISGTGVTVDHNNNVYITGIYVDSISFGTTALAGSTNSNNYSCSYITKYDASGNLVWAKGAGTGPVLANGICVDAAGNSYLAGIAAQATISATSFGNSYSSFIAKYDNNGNVRWAVNPGYSNILSSTIVCYGNSLFTTGHASNSIYAAKTDTAGSNIWTKFGTGTGTTTNGSIITADNQGNCYLAGSFRNSLAFGTTSLSILPGNTSQQDAFLIKFDGTGNIQWNRTLVSSGNNDDNISAICADNAGGIYVSGLFTYQTNFGSVTLPTSAVNPTGGFVAKYDATSGNNSWATYTSAHAGLSMAVDTSGIYYIGSFQSSETLGTLTISNTSFWPSMFITKMHSGSVVGLETLAYDDYGMLVYPNPASINLNIALSTHWKNVQIDVFNITGQKIYSTQNEVFDKTIVPCSNWERGIYFVKVRNDEAQKTTKVVIE
ncbi:MAG: T9SS type A sorting domain-containing protein [Bacteroidota bacterium]